MAVKSKAYNVLFYRMTPVAVLGWVVCLVLLVRDLQRQPVVVPEKPLDARLVVLPEPQKNIPKPIPPKSIPKVAPTHPRPVPVQHHQVPPPVLPPPPVVKAATVSPPKAAIVSPSPPPVHPVPAAKADQTGPDVQDQAMVIVRHPMPQIPDDLADAASGQQVTVELNVDASGHIKVRLTQPSQVPELNRLIEETLSHWQIRPAIRNGIAVASSQTLSLSF